MLTQEQQQRRLKGIGGSDAACIMGFSKYSTPLQVWLEKTGRSKFEPTEESHPWLHWGKILEPVIANEYARLKEVELYSTDTLFHPEHQWMLGHPDRMIRDRNRLLECKIARESRASKEWGDGADEIPLAYIIQINHYMAITGRSWADLAVLIGNSDFRIYSIQRDEQIINAIIKECGEFFREYVLKDMPPPPKDGKDASFLWGEDNGKYRDADNEEKELCVKYDLLRRDIKEREKAKKSIGDQLRIKIEDFSGLRLGPKKTIVTYKANKKGVRSLLVK